MQGGPSYYLPDHPCWTCHWFGYLRAENRHGFCVNPQLHAMAVTPSTGCAFWRREPGADDDMARPAAVEDGSPACRAVQRERARLVRIQEQGERARLPLGMHAVCGSRDGFLVVGGWRIRPDTVPAAEAEIERLGVNAAIRAGRL